MTAVERLAEFAVKVPFEELSTGVREQLKIRVLDSLGCAIGGLSGRPLRLIHSYRSERQGHGRCTLVAGGCAEVERAAFYNGALARYLDFNDSYVAKGETCHPSDNLAPLLAAAETAGKDGRDLLTAMAVAYQVQCRLSDVAPVRAAGFDHTVQGSYAVAAGIARVLGFDVRVAANALALCGTALNALRVSRTGRRSEWQALAYPFMASCAIRLAFLAHAGISGPAEVIEGEKGLMDAITGVFEIDWPREELDRVPHTILKKYNSGIHAQTAIEAALELKRRHRFTPDEIERVEVEIFEVAYHTAGGGEDGDRTDGIDTREQAVESLPYLVAVAILDGQVMPEQYQLERIRRTDVQQMLRRVSIRPNSAYSERFPKEMPCRVQVVLRDGHVLAKEAWEYLGFVSQPMSWESCFQKFEQLAGPYTTPPQRREIADRISHLEDTAVQGLMRLLGEVRAPEELNPL
ncbi:MAG TPA: MmgE/PrpD family protein [Bryobacteraceae bacterium]|nr:MmgE/PrpD family protein [Bryobacteraceae bacterium]